MSIRCPHCHSLNENSAENSFCEYCGKPLAPAAVGDSFPPVSSPQPNPPRMTAPSISPPPIITPPRYIPSSDSGMQTPSSSPAIRPPSILNARPPAPAHLGRPAPVTQALSTANTIEGQISEIVSLQPENPDRDIPGILATILLIGDMIFILGWVGLIILIILIVLAFFVNIGCLLSLLGLLLGPLLSILSGRRRQEEKIPVTNYILRTADGQDVTFRIKGQLRGATPQKYNRVRIWGFWRHSILYLRGGQNLDSGETYTLPCSYSIYWLAALVLLNITAIIYIYTQFSR